MSANGLSIETAAGVIARDNVKQFMQQFALTIRRSRPAGQDVVAAYVDALAGALALTIAGGHGAYWEIVAATEAKLREAVDRDLRHLKAT